MVLAVLTSAPAVVLMPPPEVFGVEPEEVLSITATLSRAILDTTATPPLVGEAIDDDCLVESACVVARLKRDGADNAVVVAVIRSGENLDVHERFYGKDGALVVEHRRLTTMPAFETAPLSAPLALALAPTTTTTTTATTTTATTTAGTTPAAPTMTKTLGVAIAGSALTLGGVAGLALGANTVGSAVSSGDDKEAAYVYGWAGVVGIAVGVTTVGVALGLGAGLGGPP